MAGEYSINLTNGSVLTTIHPLEVNGGTSTPRQIVNMTSNMVSIVGKLSYRFTPGYIFSIVNPSSPLDPRIGSYTTLSSTEVHIGSNILTDPETLWRTDITVTTAIPSPNVLPRGQVQYTVSPDTSLSLPGKGVINFGESLIENTIRLTENFAADTTPGSPLVGQHWYRTLTGSEAMMTWDGTQWSSNIDVDDGELRFKDSQAGPGIDMILSASAPGDNDFGLSLRPSLTSAPPTLSLFRVVDHTSTVEYLRVETGGYVRMYNSLEVQGLNDSKIYGRLGIGDNGIPALTNTLTVEGSGIDVNGATGFHANLNLNAPPTMQSRIGFVTGGVQRGEIFVDGGAVGHPIEINNSTNANVHLVSGTSTGNVGIGTSNPSAKLHVTGNTYVSGVFQSSSAVHGDRVIAYSTTTPAFAFGGNEDSGFSHDGGVVSNIYVTMEGVNTTVFEQDGTLSVLTPNYETLVTSNNDIPNKKYVDDAIIIGASGGAFVNETGDTMTGTLIINTGAVPGPALNITVPSGDAVSINGGPINMNTQQITNVMDPTNPQDVATKKYIDDQLALAFALSVIGL